MFYAVATLASLFLVACAEPAPSGKRYLIDQYQWVHDEVASDYYGAPPEDLNCDPEFGTVTEDLGGEMVYSVYTQYCSWITVTQPSLSSISEGEEFYLRFWHATLTAPMGSNAHIVVTIDGDVIWDNEFPIPYPSGLDVVTLLAPKDYPEAAQIVYHVDNHGNNEYSLVELSIR